MKTNEEREIDFMVGLTKLTKETGIAIFGCGCCGSPGLDLKEPNELTAKAGYGYGFEGKVTWISPADEYDWKNYRKTIVKEKP